jgi:DNA-binding CsgD family transcriptional regulator
VKQQHDAPPKRERSVSRREREVLALMARGFTNKEIARVLVVTDATIKCHVGQILAKLDARNRTHAVAIWRTMPEGGRAEDLATSLIDRALATTRRPREFQWLRAKQTEAKTNPYDRDGAWSEGDATTRLVV